jgi:transposase InsO family protein
MRQTLREELASEALTNLLQAETVFARVVRRYNEEGLQSVLGYLTPADYCLGNPTERYAARTKLAQARHQRKENNLELQQRTYPLSAREGVASN